MQQLPDFEAWAIFVKAAETGSFAQAAEALSLSQATVSKAISRLEKRLNISLFHRTSRRITLTETGRLMLKQAVQLLETAEYLEQSATEQTQTLQGVIKIAMSISFGVRCVAPLLADFLAEHSNITLDLQFSDEHADLVAEGFDFAIRIAKPEDSSLLARSIGRVRTRLVASPHYLARYGEPKHPSELSQHQILQYVHSRQGGNWRFRHEQQGEVIQRIQPNVRANNSDAFTPLLLSGFGIALQPEFMLGNMLQEGRLKHILADWKTDEFTLFLLAPPSRRRPVRVQALMDYLAERLGKIGSL